MTIFTQLLADVRACSLCASHLEHGVRPVVQINPKAKILIAGQAPGIKVHESGVAFNDASGDRLRQWMGVDKSTFYDDSKIAILPMGFCFPGTGKSGDLPPRPECAPAWREKLLAQLPNLQLTLVIGKYAQSYHLNNNKSTVTQTVKSWQSYWPNQLPLPHPSPRNNIWLKRNSWFEGEVIPHLQQRIAKLL
ncbi:uracil-DNA glycosylase family protein [Thalassomonas sp. M1454]|uniref:uracil-DNA glycosylase family protein n=1 Tax=Thalassomonas sp. M1454 TaxID=2594477 RepID=UPI00117DCE5D|nr:uracil-DNA glycosylase family protein [Thalassomonas sp. M1454]TRX55050.1 uracil-DNA glycosylase family protein [Thalassomonas sp. M1454]